jgi:hypothetical protein
MAVASASRFRAVPTPTAARCRRARTMARAPVRAGSLFATIAAVPSGRRVSRRTSSRAPAASARRRTTAAATPGSSPVPARRRSTGPRRASAIRHRSTVRVMGARPIPSGARAKFAYVAGGGASAPTRPPVSACRSAASRRGSDWRPGPLHFEPSPQPATHSAGTRFEPGEGGKPSRGVFGSGAAALDIAQAGLVGPNGVRGRLDQPVRRMPVGVSVLGTWCRGCGWHSSVWRASPNSAEQRSPLVKNHY